MAPTVKIDSTGQACALLMAQFPGLSRQVVTDVVGAYRERTATISDAYDAAWERLTDACSAE